MLTEQHQQSIPIPVDVVGVKSITRQLRCQEDRRKRKNRLKLKTAVALTGWVGQEEFG